LKNWLMPLGNEELLSLVHSFCVKYRNYSRTRNMSMLDSERAVLFYWYIAFLVKFLSHKLIVSQTLFISTITIFL